ncbi:hypothetical protein NQ317_011621 [Molorchus minor]|uniref:Carboxylesterase type B domain-containing protein n=1 Tax=Molorchus minor TaxID=1323400 RepID=A0ABQ9J2W2_9CUCU|nr:hypothetical protein NQ317_011621 [Molorchus minor]
MQDNPGKSLAYFSDNSYARPIIKHAQLQSKYADERKKVGHGEERNYYFRTQTDTYDNSDLNKFPVLDVEIHYRIVKIWTNFAKTMNPTPEQNDLLQNITWPKVNPENFQQKFRNKKRIQKKIVLRFGTRYTRNGEQDLSTASKSIQCKDTISNI